MSEYASNEVRIHAAKGNPMGLLGQVMFFVDYYSMSVDRGRWYCKRLILS